MVNVGKYIPYIDPMGCNIYGAFSLTNMRLFQDPRCRSSMLRLERPLDARVVQRYVPHAVRRT